MNTVARFRFIAERWSKWGLVKRVRFLLLMIGLEHVANLLSRKADPGGDQRA